MRYILYLFTLALVFVGGMLVGNIYLPERSSSVAAAISVPDAQSAHPAIAAATLDAAPIVARQRMRQLTMALPMDAAGRIETVLRAQGVHLEPTSYAADHAKLTLAVPDEPTAIDAMVERLAGLSSGSASPVWGVVSWFDQA